MFFKPSIPWTSNSLQNYKIVDKLESKAFADKKLNVADVVICVFVRTVFLEKGEKAAFLPFPKMLSNAFSFRIVKNRGLSGKALTHYQTTDFGLFQTDRVCRQQFQI